MSKQRQSFAFDKRAILDALRGGIPSGCVVFGSANLVLRGLRRKAADIDILAADESTLLELGDIPGVDAWVGFVFTHVGNEQTKRNGIEVAKRAFWTREYVEDIPCVSLEVEAAWRRLLDRPKDREVVDLLNSLLE